MEKKSFVRQLLTATPGRELLLKALLPDLPLGGNVQNK